jgi:uncharacterized YigZ family protein
VVWVTVSLKAPVQAEIEVKKSRFLAWVEPVADHAAAQVRLAELRHRYADARHLCFAFYVNGSSGMSDDGEPSGTAGKPIFSVLSHKRLVNVLAVVVRYFGGVKLGAGGLVRAYSGAVSRALENADWVVVEAHHEVVFELPFALESDLRRLLDHYGLAPQRVDYSTGVQMQLTVAESALEPLLQAFIALAPHRNDLTVSVDLVTRPVSSR